MAFDVGSITGKLVLDTNKWDAALKKSKVNVKSFEGAVLRSEKRIRQFGVALGIAGAAITAMNVKLVKMAAVAQESENLFEVSMGGMADATRKWSEELSKELGLNQFEIRRTTGVLNVMLKSMGISEKAAYEMSTSLVKLSQDMASFYDLAPDEVFRKIQSGIVGMPRPLQDLGIVINETTIKQFALTNGLIQQGEQMTTQQKILARYGAIIEATQSSQGDLRRTLYSLTNQMRIFGGQSQEVSIVLGTTLIPITTNLYIHMNKFLDVIKKFTYAFPRTTQVVIMFTAALGALSVVAGAVLLILPGLARAATAAGTTMAAVAGGIALKMGILSATIVGVVMAIQHFDFLKGIFYAFAQSVNESIASVQKGLKKLMEILATLPGPQQALFAILARSYSNSITILEKQAEVMAQKAVNAFAERSRKIIEITNEIKEATETSLADFESLFEQTSSNIGQTLNQVEKGTKNWLQNMQEDFNVWEEMGRRTFTAMSDNMSNLFFDAVTGELHSLQDAFANFGRSVLRIISDIVAQWVTMKIMTGLFGDATNTFSASIPTPSRYGGSVTIPGVGGANMPSFATGIENVPFDMIAKIHQGERVVPAEENSESGLPLTIYNIITNEAVANAMQSREGADVIINTINSDSMRNGIVRREVGRR